MMTRLWVGLMLMALPVLAADFYVDNVVGDDALDGLAKAPGVAPAGPVRTIDVALRKAGPGDTVHLNPTGKLYRQTANYYGLPGGEEGKPLTLDGHGATLCGAEDALPDGWQAYRDATLQRSDLVGLVFVDNAFAPFIRRFDALEEGEWTYDPAFSKRFYFRFPKGVKKEDVSIEVGQPDGTSVTLDMAKFAPSHSSLPGCLRYQGLEQPTWVKINGREQPLILAQDRLKPGEYTVSDKVLYYNPPAGRPLADVHVQVLVRENGVMMSGETKYVVVRNVNATLVSNDGFNIHGHVTRAEFYNCNAWDTGDEGFSAHDACETLLDGAVYTNNDNGIANVNYAGWSITRNVVLQRARHVGYLIQVSAAKDPKAPAVWHELTNAILVDNPSQLSAGNLKADNVLIVQTAEKPRCSALGLGAGVTLSRATIAGNSSLLRLGAGSQVTLDRVLIAPGQGVMHIRADETFGVWTLSHVVMAPEQVIQWGAKYPWQELPASEWLPQAEAKGIAKDCELREVSMEQALSGDAAAGCTQELLKRATTK